MTNSSHLLSEGFPNPPGKIGGSQSLGLAQTSQPFILLLCSLLRSVASLDSEFVEGSSDILGNSVFAVPGVSRWPAKILLWGGMDSLLGKHRVGSSSM